VGNLADSKLDGILNRWLKEDQRALQAEQREALMASLADIDEGAPGASALLLRLAYRHCLHFASYDTELNLPQSINAYVQSLFERLEFHYGDVLVSRAFAYLACARHGLSEKEWLDLLSCDDEVMDAVLQYHRPPIRRLPSAVFTRMRLELDDYLVERSADGQPVFYWKYRLFHNVSALRYVGNVGKRRAICMHLADYFDGKKYESFPGREIDPQPLLFESSTEERKEKKVAEVAVVPNMRRLSELPNALLGAGDRQRLVDRLSDIRTFRLYVADEALVQELMQHWRDIEDLEDPVVAYSRALTQQLGDSKDARAILNTAELYNQVGRFFNKSARYEAAIDMCTQALSMREKVLGANHVDLAADVGLLATMRTSKGQFDEAMPLLIRACDILVLNYGEDDPRVCVYLS
jgi:tetratricopeptide (TPR) repeat protein